MKLRCHRCQNDLDAYIQHKLPIQRRRAVAAHLDQCPVCYGVYLQQQALMQDLQHNLPRFGQPARPALDRVWAAVQAEMVRPRAVIPVQRTRMAVTAILLMLLIPMAMAGRGRAFTIAALPTQPAPLIERATPVATSVGMTPTTVAFYVTPAPPQQTAGPALDVFNTP